MKGRLDSAIEFAKQCGCPSNQKVQLKKKLKKAKLSVGSPYVHRIQPKKVVKDEEKGMRSEKELERTSSSNVEIFNNVKENEVVEKKQFKRTVKTRPLSSGCVPKANLKYEEPPDEVENLNNSKIERAMSSSLKRAEPLNHYRPTFLRRVPTVFASQDLEKIRKTLRWSRSAKTTTDSHSLAQSTRQESHQQSDTFENDDFFNDELLISDQNLVEVPLKNSMNNDDPVEDQIDDFKEGDLLVVEDEVPNETVSMSSSKENFKFDDNLTLGDTLVADTSDPDFDRLYSAGFVVSHTVEQLLMQSMDVFSRSFEQLIEVNSKESRNQEKFVQILGKIEGERDYFAKLNQNLIKEKDEICAKTQLELETTRKDFEQKVSYLRENLVENCILETSLMTSMDYYSKILENVDKIEKDAAKLKQSEPLPSTESEVSQSTPEIFYSEEILILKELKLMTENDLSSRILEQQLKNIEFENSTVPVNPPTTFSPPSQYDLTQQNTVVERSLMQSMDVYSRSLEQYLKYSDLSHQQSRVSTPIEASVEKPKPILTRASTMLFEVPAGQEKSMDDDVSVDDVDPREEVLIMTHMDLYSKYLNKMFEESAAVPETGLNDTSVLPSKEEEQFSGVSYTVEQLLMQSMDVFSRSFEQLMAANSKESVDQDKFSQILGKIEGERDYFAKLNQSLIKEKDEICAKTQLELETTRKDFEQKVSYLRENLVENCLLETSLMTSMDYYSKILENVDKIEKDSVIISQNESIPSTESEASQSPPENMHSEEILILRELKLMTENDLSSRILEQQLKNIEFENSLARPTVVQEVSNQSSRHPNHDLSVENSLMISMDVYSRCMEQYFKYIEEYQLLNDKSKPDTTTSENHQHFDPPSSPAVSVQPDPQSNQIKTPSLQSQTPEVFPNSKETVSLPESKPIYNEKSTVDKKEGVPEQETSNHNHSENRAQDTEESRHDLDNQERAQSPEETVTPEITPLDIERIRNHTRSVESKVETVRSKVKNDTSSYSLDRLYSSISSRDASVRLTSEDHGDEDDVFGFQSDIRKHLFDVALSTAKRSELSRQRLLSAAYED
ncbi:hypothetical protein GEMRC1_011009 [Eukaryota sp. GEM-RC1]